jgi:hypothetical protein
VSDKRERLLSEYSDIKAFNSGFEVTDEIVQGLIEYGTKKGVEYDEEGFRKMQEQITYSIKALIAQILWSADGYFLVMSAIDEGFQKAIEVLQGKN